MTTLRSLSKSVVYGTLDRLTGGRGISRVIGGERVRFPARWSRYYESDYEPVTFDFLRRHCREGNTVLDIGAHIGLFSVLIARLVGASGRVFSFEPTPLTREVLRETIEINGCGDIVEVRAEAVSKTSGTATFFDTGDTVSNANSLVQTERHANGVSVETVTVDSFASDRDLFINCLKIDVEGAELDVLLGCERTMATQRPAMSLALHPMAMRQAGATLDQIWDVLREYRMAVTYLHRPVDRAWFVEQEDLFDVQCLPELLSVPPA